MAKTIKSPIKHRVKKGKDDEYKYDPSKQVEGLKTRFEGAGLDGEDVADKRNTLEKALNLKEDQNVLFDFFELLGRPQQALFGATKSALEGNDLFEGAWDGIAGNEETKFKDILHETGFEETEDEFGMDDVLGFAGDVSLDPMKVKAFNPKLLGESSKLIKTKKSVEESAKLVETAKTTLVASEAELASAIKIADNLKLEQDKVIGALEIAKKVRDDSTLKAVDLAKKKWGNEYADVLASIKVDLDIINDVNELDYLEELTLAVKEKTKDSLKTVRTKNTKVAADKGKLASEELAKGMLDKKLKVAENMSKKPISASQFVTRKIGSGFKGTLGIADSGLTKLFGWMDKNTNLANIEKGVSISNAFNDSLTGWSKMYETIKDTVTNTFNHKAKLPEGLQNYVSKITGGQHYAKDRMLQIYESRHAEFTNIVDKIVEDAKEAGLSNTDALDVERALFAIYENGQNLFGKDIGFEHILSESKTVNVTLSGMNRSTSLQDILFADRYLQNMGLTEQNAEKFESMVKVMFPDWYKDNIENGTRKLFRISEDSSGITKNQHRIFNKGMQEELRNEFRKLGDDTLVNIDPTKQKDLIRFMSAGDDSKYKEMAKRLQSYTNEEKTLNRLNSDLDSYKRLLQSGETTHYDLDKAREAKIFTDINNINIYGTRSKEIKEQLNELIGKKGNANIIKNLNEELLNTEKLLKEAHDKVELFKLENSENLTDLISRNTLRINEGTESLNEFKQMLGIGKSKVSYDGKSLKEMAESTFNLGNHFTDDYIETLQKYYDFESTKEALASIHLLQTEAAEMITKYVGAGLQLDDYYLSHTLTKEWQEAQKEGILSKPLKDITGANKFSGNTVAFQARRYQASVVEANKMAEGYFEWLKETGSITEDIYLDGRKKFDEGMKMFSEDIGTSFIDFVTKGTRTAADAHIYKAVVESTLIPTSDSLSNLGKKKSNFVRVTPSNIESMRGFNSYNANDFMDKAKALAPYLPKEERSSFIASLQSSLDSMTTEAGGNKVWLDKNIDRMIGRVVMPENTDKSDFVKFIDKINGIFKKNKLLSPGFQFRNIVGSTSNMWLAGVPMDETIKGFNESRKILERADKLLKIKADGGVITDAKDLEILALFDDFAANGFTETGNRLHDIPKDILNPTAAKNDTSYKMYKDAVKAGQISRDPTVREQASKVLYGYNSLVEFNMHKNMQYDSIQRLTLYRYAKTDAGRQWMFENGYTSPEEAVRMVLFDYTDLSEAEQEVMKRLIPFYTFTKKNIAFQMQNIAKNTNRYIGLKQMNDSLWSSFIDDEEEMDRHKLENFWIPIPVKDDEGNYKAIKASLPLGGFGEFMSSPLRQSVASTAPLVRAPFEIASNTQMFSGMPIKSYEGQKGYGVPEISSTAEYGLSQLGLDVPLMGIADPIRSFANLGTDEGATDPFDFLTQAAGRSVMSSGNTQKTAERKAYDRLDHLQNQLRSYRSKGIDIPTMAEINNRSKFASSNKILGRLRSYRK